MVFNSLFNQHLMDKYIKKHKKEFKLTHSRKEALLKWKKMLDSGELKNEESNYGNFSHIILEDLLGYEHYNDIKEHKKVDYGKGRSEFIIYKNKEKFMVIELKGSNTDLDKPQAGRKDNLTPVEQSFKYVQDSKESLKWILVSNYDEFRLYNYEKRSHQYISFKFEELLEPETFKKFMLIFSRFSTIENNLIEKLVSKTVFVERELEDEFYKLYNETRLMLIAELEHIHPEFTRDESVHYSQLILNRYIFICFAEDLGLLPEEISVKTIENPIKNRDIGHNEIWHRMNSLFIDINVGNEFKKIYGYNGGLFNEDLESLKIRDIIDDHSIFKDAYQKWKFEEYSLIVEEKLSPYGNKINPIYKNLMTIATFNFSTELDVNILGHIFENSIGEIEELKADTKGRRKKEGIYYTPEYITDYICRNTIIPYLSKSGKANTVDKLIGEYYGLTEIEKLDEKVEKIKIVDPACGSGAFLNKASDILLEIHEAIFNEKYGEKTTMDRFFDSIEERRKILLDNIYGVDLNEESVEITKLSLFLKVCKKGLKLPNLDNNIKCGNSLINDPEYTDKPFKWKKEFKGIFDEDGFDIVVGNPPYIRIQTLNYDKNMIKFFRNTYESAIGNYDIYNLFVEKSLELVKEKHEIGFILPNKFILADYGKGLRNIINESSALQSIINFQDNQLFKGASTYTCLLFLKKNTKQFKYAEIKLLDDYETAFNIIDSNEEYDDSNISVGVLESEEYLKEQWNFYIGKSARLIKRLTEMPIKLEDNVEKIFQGLATSADKIYIVKSVRHLGNLTEIYSEETGQNHIIENEMLKKVIKGKETKKYGFDYQDRYLIHPYILNKDDYRLIEPELLEKNYPNAWKYLKLNEKKIRARERGKMDHDKWYAFTYPKSMLDYRNKKIMTPNSAFNASFSYDTEGEYYTTTGVAGGFAIKLKKDSKFNEWYLLTILNSSLMNFFNKKIGKSLQGGFYSFEGRVIKNYPLIEINNEEQQIFIQKAKEISYLVSNFIKEIKNFKDWIKRTYKIEKLSKKLDKYYELSFDEFLNELKKKKVDIKPRKTQELLKKEFEESLDKINPLLLEIEKTDNEIDQMVYELYGLSEDEIKIIEDSLGSI